jgi:putative spermidine/putrescine transport system substrate-binding protein
MEDRFRSPSWTRRDFIMRSMGAVGVFGLGGLTLVSCGDDGEGSGSTSGAKLEVRTMGLGTTVLDPILKEFEKETGIKGKGTVLAFGDMVPQWINGGYENQWDTIEAQGAQVAPIWDAETLQPVPRSELQYWDQALSLFTEQGDPGQDADGHPFNQIYTPESIDSGSFDQMMIVPTVWNGDSIGYRTDLINEKLTSYAALWDPQFKGKVALFNSSLRAPMEVLLTESENGNYTLERTVGNPSRADIDYAIDFLIDKKKQGQFRLLWDDYGQAVELLASGEVSLMNAWEPIVREVVGQGKPAVYGRVQEGYNMWFHGIAVSSAVEDLDPVIEFINFWHSGFPGAQVAGQGYISPVPETVKPVLEEQSTNETNANDWEYWYEGEGRDRGSIEEIASRAGWWWQFPEESEYLDQRWQEFVSA